MPVIGLLLFLLLLNGSAFADSFELNETKLTGKSAVVVRLQLNTSQPQLDLFWKNDQGTSIKTFEALEGWLRSKNKSLLFATNGGIYRDTPDFAPIGLHVEKGSIKSRLSFAKGCGNFCWYSGVFWIEDTVAQIVPREEIAPKNFSRARLALQSGPLLIRSGALQGSWSGTSLNRNRSAVCTTTQSGEVLLILVTDETNLTQFFHSLKQAGCRNGLFLDGEVSAFFDGKQRKRFGHSSESYAGFLAVTASIK